MLGLQETKSHGTPTTKTYSCVACSATFQSLASLLVHQASHANEIACQPKSTQPTCVTCGSLFASADLLEKHHCMVLPTPTAQEMHVCDCGEEFGALSALEEHKKIHMPDAQVSLSLNINPKDLKMELDSKTNSSNLVSDQASPNLLPCDANKEALVKSASSSSEADIKDMASNTDTSVLMEENVKSVSSASEADIKDMASSTDTSVLMEENVKSASSASEADIKDMASTTDTSVPMEENVKSASASEADIKDMASNTDTSVLMEENVKSASASEADIKDMASNTDTSVLMEENVKSASASEADIKDMASNTDTSVLMEENVKSASASEADIKDMASTTDTSVPMEENVKSASASEADIKDMASSTDTSVLMEENVKSASASEADIKDMASTTDTSVLMEENVKSASSASEADIEIASTTDISIPVENSFVNEQDEDVLKPHKSLLSHPVTEGQEPVLENNSDTLQPSSTSNHPEHVSEESASSHIQSTACNKKSILKILASAYMSHRQPGHIKPVPTKRNLPPRKVAPRAPMQAAPAITLPKSETQENQFKTNCPIKVLSFPCTAVNVKTGKKKKKKRKKIISVIQTLYPVVMLETRQKLFGKDKIEGRHKCGICRRIFQNPDNLIMHHAQHKKERVKFCFRCQQFVICAAENHKCFSTFAGNSQHLPVVANKSPTLPSPCKRRPFQCSLCKRTYLWKRNLKRHTLKGKCTPIVESAATAGNQDDGKISSNLSPISSNLSPISSKLSPISSKFPPNTNKLPPNASKLPPNFSKLPPNPTKLDSKNDGIREVQDPKINDMSKQHVNVGVGTEIIKTEEQNTEFSIEGKNQAVLKIPCPTLKPVNQLPSPSFVSNSKPTPKSTKIEQNVELPANVVETEADDTDTFEEKQWTMPLDDAEIDVLIDADQEEMDEDNFADMAKKDHIEEEDVVIVESPDEEELESLLPSNGFKVHVSDEGIKRFVCAGCQRSYSRRFTLMQHLSICGARKLKQLKLFEKTPSSVSGPIKQFPCPQCGNFFSRKDNMNMHRKRCKGTVTNPSIVPSIVENKTQPAQENLFVLSPSTETPSVRPESSRSSSGNWGIMSLPPVLPRRVTCECGASFTCPRLLFEHLQLHAQESYICPHCGENLQSWMDFEAHQQMHRQSQSQAVEQRGPQLHPHPFSQMTQLHVPTPQQPRSFSQVLQSQIPSGQSPGFQTSEINLNVQPPALLPPQNLNLNPYPETVTCHRCKKIFSGRRSLLRHLRLSCRGDAAGQKKHSGQIQSNASKPTFKPLRCPVCVRWFSCLDGLKRHLVSHSRQPVLSCQQCGQNCPSYQALEEHKRNVHKINSIIVSANVKREQVCKGAAKSTQSTPPTDFQCHICLRYYPKLQSLKDHVRKVHRPKQAKPINLTVVDPFRSGQFQCQICMRAYPDIKSLKNHRRRVHRILGGAFQPAKGTEQNRTPDHFECQICGSSYPDTSSLQNHKRTVHRILGGLELGNPSANPTQSVQVSNLSVQLS